jgi:transcriptional regulator with XRE-family HTH domain
MKRDDPQTGTKAVGERLTRLRESYDMTPAEFCRWTGFGQQAWSNYERGYRLIRLDQALRLGQVTGASLDWIYRGDASGLPFRLASKLLPPASERA